MLRLSLSACVGTLLTLQPIVAGAQKSDDHDMPEAVRAIAGVRLNSDSAASLTARLGPAIPWKTGSTGHDRYVNWCYQNAANGGVTLLVRSDAGEMGSENQELNVFEITRGARSTIDGHLCREVEVQLESIGSLRLGAQRDAVIRTLGAPSRTAGDSLVYEFSATESMNPHSPYYARWNTPEQRTSCFDGKDPFVWVGGVIIIVTRGGTVTVVRVERYDNAIC